MTNYRLDLYDKNGVKKAILSDTLNLTYNVKINHAGRVNFALNGDHDMARQIQPGWRCDIWRQLPTGTWRKEMVSFIESWQWTYTDRPLMKFTGSGVLSLLAKRIVAYYANTASKTAFNNQKTENIVTSLMYFNIGAGATTANGRMVDGVNSAIMIPASSNRGISVDWFCAWQNLLKTLQELAEAGGFDFDLVPVGNNYLFTYYPDRLGSDRTNEIVFSLERGNIINPTHYLITGNSATVAIVGGKGEESEREVETVTKSSSYDPFNGEIFVNATDIDTTSGLLQRGDDKLSEIIAKPKFEFDILQAENARWNVDYFLGDLVKVITPMEQLPVTAEIDSATVSFDKDGKENIQIGVKSE